MPNKHHVFSNVYYLLLAYEYKGVPGHEENIEGTLCIYGFVLSLQTPDRVICILSTDSSI